MVADLTRDFSGFELRDGWQKLLSNALGGTIDRIRDHWRSAKSKTLIVVFKAGQGLRPRFVKADLVCDIAAAKVEGAFDKKFAFSPGAVTQKAFMLKAKMPIWCALLSPAGKTAMARFDKMSLADLVPDWMTAIDVYIEHSVEEDQLKRLDIDGLISTVKALFEQTCLEKSINVSKSFGISKLPLQKDAVRGVFGYVRALAYLLSCQSALDEIGFAADVWA